MAGSGPEARQFLQSLALSGASIAAGFAPNTAGSAHALYALSQLMQKSDEREREQKASAAFASRLAALGIPSDPSLPPSAAGPLANVYLASEKMKREQAEQARSRDIFGRIATLRSGIPGELPEVSREQMSALAPELGRAPELREGFEKGMGEIAQQEKRLSQARRIGKPYETTETFTFEPPPQPPSTPRPTLDQPVVDEDVAPSLGVGPLRPPPPLSLTTVPENVHALQRQVMETGALPTVPEAEQLGVDLSRYPGGREAMVKRRQEEAQLRQTEALGRKTTAEAQALEVGAPFRAEMEILKLQKLRQEVEQGKMPSLTGDIVNRLRATPGVDPRNPTPEQVAKAITDHEAALTARAVDAARQQGLAAAQIPARTPVEQQKATESIVSARSQMTELARLAPAVNLPSLVGGIRPWANQIIQTGKIGPIPIPAGSLTPEQNRFLALVQDYADSVLRLRSGAQINEQEFQRMLAFLMQPGVTADVFTARMQLQDDLLRVKQEIQAEVLRQSGYRAPSMPPPSMSPGPPKVIDVEREP